MRRLLSFILCFFSTVFLFSFPSYSGEGNPVVVATVRGVINPVAGQYISKAIESAGRKKAAALVIELDTPGGLDTSMREIVKAILGSRVPVVVYVAPGGAMAASAGVFIAMASHVAAMSPGTAIGAAHPVSVTEKMDKVMAEKATNDAAAYARSLAEKRGRNGQWAEDAVRKSISATETEALGKGIVDLLAPDLKTLLKEIHGRRVVTAGGEQLLDTAGARIIREEMGIRDRLLDLISDPNVAYVLMLLGFYGLFFELTSPGAVFPGVVGAVSLILAFYSFQTIPVNYAGLLLIITGIILFILEVKVTSYGMLTIGGIASLVMGSLMLFDSPAPFLRLSLAVIIPAAVVTALFFGVTIRLAYRAFKRRPVTGIEGLAGLEGKAHTEITPEGGTVFVHGEFWSAFSDSPLPRGAGVVVTEVRGMRLKVDHIT
ncbi:MAG: nodulation protein NfeD [Thermodesulfovibrionales bacterium]|jgi:membrane-bound serine protease (ClpP class)